MPWVRLSDDFYRNDKQLSMSDGAFRLYVCALSMAMEEKEPTGYFTTAKARGLAGFIRKGPSAIKELVAVNAWEQMPDGYLIHDFEEYLQEGSRERTRQWRQRKRQECGVTDPSLGDGDVASPVTGIPVRDPVRARVIPDPKPRTQSRNPEGGFPLAPIGPLSPEAQAICDSWLARGKQLPAIDRENVEGMVSEFRVLTAEEFVTEMETCDREREQRGDQPIRRLMGYRERFRRLNDLLRDQGRRDRGLPVLVASNGMASLASVLPQVMP